MNDIQHNQIALDFIGQIATQLQIYGQSQGYSLSSQYYNDLAWGGLTGTNEYASLSQTDRNRIDDALNTEQNSTDRYGNPVNFMGKAITCH